MNTLTLSVLRTDVGPVLGPMDLAHFHYRPASVVGVGLGRGLGNLPPFYIKTWKENLAFV